MTCFDKEEIVMCTLGCFNKGFQGNGAGDVLFGQINSNSKE